MAVDVERRRRKSRPKRVITPHTKKGAGPEIAVRIRKEAIPNGLQILEAANRLEFMELTGIRIPDDLNWDAAPSRRIEVILETLGRLSKENQGEDKH